jgi:flagellar hook-associated protein 3 FlgL
MRVSTLNTYDSTISSIQKRSEELVRTQDKLSAGQRVLNASDDPAAAALAERERNRLQRIDADTRALEASRRSLMIADSALSSISDLYQRAKELIVQGGSAILNKSDRASLASELSGIRERILELTNTRDALGRPVFSGLGVSNPDGMPFVENFKNPVAKTYGEDGRVVSWIGMKGQEAATSTSLPLSLNGYDIFKADNTVYVQKTNSSLGSTSKMSAVATGSLDERFTNSNDSKPVGGFYVLTYRTDPAGDGYFVTFNPGDSVESAVGPFQGDNFNFQGVLDFEISGTSINGDEFVVYPDADIWEVLDLAIISLQSADGFELTESLGRANGQLDIRMDKLLSARGRLGDWMNRADQMDASFKERAVYHEQQKSDLIDLDMVEGISKFQTQQLGLQAALQSYAQVQRLSLFQYIA